MKNYLNMKDAYENFLSSRPLQPGFKKVRYDIPELFLPTLTIDKLEHCYITNYGELNKSRKLELSHYVVSAFRADSLLESWWQNPQKKLLLLRKCLCALTFDFSVTSSMAEARIIESTYKNRWIGCYWQESGVACIPTVSWAGEKTYEICALGIPHGSPIAISTCGVQDLEMFIKGYNWFMEHIDHAYVICVGKIIAGMKGKIVHFEHSETFMVDKQKNDQIPLFEVSRINDL